MRVLRVFFIAVLSVRALTGGTTCALGADAKPVVDPTGPFFVQHCPCFATMLPPIRYRNTPTRSTPGIGILLFILAAVS